MFRKVHQLWTLWVFLFGALLHQNVLWDAQTSFWAITGDRTGGWDESVLTFRGPCHEPLKPHPTPFQPEGAGHSSCFPFLFLLSLGAAGRFYSKWMNMEWTTLSLRFTSFVQLCKLNIFTQVYSAFWDTFLLNSFAHFLPLPTLFSGISVSILDVSLFLDMCLWAFSSFAQLQFLAS